MKTLTDKDFARAAKHLNCEDAAIRAVAEVESSGSGFLKDGRCKVLFEGHIFHRETQGRFAETHPTLSFPKWAREHYARGATAEARGAGEIARLAEAMQLDPTAAQRSASFGQFQIMGFNHRACMYPQVGMFVDAMRLDAAAHLDAFCHIIKSMGLSGALRHQLWVAFAKRYNGPSYNEHDYDGKLARAYEKFAEKAKAQV